MKTAIVTGAAGFAGCNLVEHLVTAGTNVYAIVRPASPHNKRLQGLSHVCPIELDIGQLDRLPALIPADCDVFFHLAWDGARDDFNAQLKNVSHSVLAVEVAKRMSCRRILITGSQAEYGIKTTPQLEDMVPEPITSYGAAKVAACYLTKNRAKQLDIEWVWGRIFSLIGKYEPAGRMLPDLVRQLRKGETPHLSSCTQYWDYLDAGDAADAMIALAKCGNNGEIYNIANGDYKPLHQFTTSTQTHISPASQILYGERANPYIELRPSIAKIVSDTGWSPRVSFMESLQLYEQ